MGTEAGVAEHKPARARARLVLLGIFALFFVPVLGAVFVAVIAPHWIPFGRVNHGELLRPAVPDAMQAVVPLDGGAAPSRGPSEPWVIAHIGRMSCGVRCKHALVQMRQARLALGKDAHRVQRWWLVTERPSASTVTKVLRAFPGLRIGMVSDQSPMARHSEPVAAVLVVDPMGFLVLQYAANLSEATVHAKPGPGPAPMSDLASAMRKDFKRLLKISRER